MFLINLNICTYMCWERRRNLHKSNNPWCDICYWSCLICFPRGSSSCTKTVCMNTESSMQLAKEIRRKWNEYKIPLFYHFKPNLKHISWKYCLISTGRTIVINVITLTITYIFFKCVNLLTASLPLSNCTKEHKTL